MTEPSRFGLGDAILLTAIVVGAAVLRIGYVSVCPPDGPNPIRVQDDQLDELRTVVLNWKEAGRFGSKAPFSGTDEPTAHPAPGYPWLMLNVSRLPGDWEQTVRLAQCVLGALTVACYYLFALRAFRSRLTAVLTGCLGALYPFWIFNCADVNDGVVASFLLSVGLLLGARAGQAGGAFTSLLYGLTLAALALVRAALLPFALVAVLWFLLRCRSLPRGWMYAFLAVLGFANGLAPWTVRNFDELGDAVPLVDSTYFHLWMGNNASSTGGPQSEAVMLQALTAIQPDMTGPRLAKASQRERQQVVARACLYQWQNDPAGSLQRRLRSGLCFLLGEEYFTTGRLWQEGKPQEPTLRADAPGAAGEQQEEVKENRPERSFPQRLRDAYPSLLYGSLGGLFLFALLGWRWSYGWWREAMPLSLALIWIPLPYLLSHVEVLSGPRLPLDGVLICYAAFALACLVPPLGRHLFRDAHVRGEVEETRLGSRET